MIVKRSSIKTSYFGKALFLVLCGALLFVGISLYYFKEYKDEQAYAKQLEVIYQLMDKSAVKAESVVSSHSDSQGVVSRQGEGIVAGQSHSYEAMSEAEMAQQLQQDSEKCHDLLSELADPPETMADIYSVLLDVHITYKQYLHLALHPQEPSANLTKKEKALNEELKNGLAIVKNRMGQM